MALGGRQLTEWIWSCSLLFLASAVAASAASPSYCAKPDLSAQEKADFDKLINNSPLTVGSAQPWPTKTIPYVIRQEAKGLSAEIDKAAAEINSLIGIRLVNCDWDNGISDHHEAKGFMVFTTAQLNSCPPEQTADNPDSGDSGPAYRSCAVVGFKPRTFPLFVFFGPDVQTSHTEFGVPIGIDPGASHGTIIHEILHSLGLEHMQEHPASVKYIKSVNPGDSSGCKPEGSGTWIPQYDPASIMHYALNTKSCGLQLIPSTGAKDSYAIDELLGDKRLCGYRMGENAPCVKRAGNELGFERDGKVYKGNRYCPSVFDQVWLTKIYSSKPMDDFELQPLIDAGKCRKP